MQPLKILILTGFLSGVFLLAPGAMAVEILLKSGRTIHALEIFDAGDHYVLDMGGNKLSILKERIEKVDAQNSWASDGGISGASADAASPLASGWSELDVIKKYYDYVDHLDHSSAVDLLLDAIDRNPEYYECHKLLCGYYEEYYRTDSLSYLYVLCRMLSRFDKIENIHIKKKLLANIKERIRKATLAFSSLDQLFDAGYALNTDRLNDEYTWEYFGRLMYLIRLYAIVHSFDISRAQYKVERPDLLSMMADHIKGRRWSFTSSDINALSVLYMLDSRQDMVPNSVRNYVIMNYRTDLRKYLLKADPGQWESLAYRCAQYLNARYRILRQMGSIYDAHNVDRVLDDCLDMAALSPVARWSWITHNVPDPSRVRLASAETFQAGSSQCDKEALARLLGFFGDDIYDDYCFFVWSRAFSRALKKSGDGKWRAPFDAVVTERMEYIRASVQDVNPQFLGASRFMEYMSRLAPAVVDSSPAYHEMAREIAREESACQSLEKLVREFAAVNVQAGQTPELQYHLSSIIQGEFKQPDASLMVPLKAELVDQRSRFYMAAMQYEGTAWGDRIGELYGLIDQSVRSIEKIEDEQRMLEAKAARKIAEERQAEERRRLQEVERQRILQARLQAALPVAVDGVISAKRVADSYLVRRRDGDPADEFSEGEIKDPFHVVHKWKIKDPDTPVIDGERILCRLKVLVDGNDRQGGGFRMWVYFVMKYDEKAQYGWLLTEVEQAE